MIMALITYLLMKMGVAPAVEDFARMDREFRERGHHVTLDFGGARSGWTRWSDEQWYKVGLIGLGYDYYIDRHYHGVGFEVLGQSMGKVFKPNRDTQSFFVGGGLAYYPIRGVRLFTHGGVQLDMHGNAEVAGRVGAGYRFMFFNVAMQPFFYVQQTSAGQPGWAMAFRFEY